MAELVNTLPTITNAVTKADTSTLYLLEGDRIYQSGLRHVTPVELPHLRQLALTLPTPESLPGGELNIPLRAGVRPRGLVAADACASLGRHGAGIGGLASIALDRAQALEDVARSEANKEGERLRTLILDSITHELRDAAHFDQRRGGDAAGLRTAWTRRIRHELLTIIDEESDTAEPADQPARWRWRRSSRRRST